MIKPIGEMCEKKVSLLLCGAVTIAALLLGGCTGASARADIFAGEWVALDVADEAKAGGLSFDEVRDTRVSLVPIENTYAGSVQDYWGLDGQMQPISIAADQKIYEFYFAEYEGEEYGEPGRMMEVDGCLYPIQEIRGSVYLVLCYRSDTDTLLLKFFWDGFMDLMLLQRKDQQSFAG